MIAWGEEGVALRQRQPWRDGAGEEEGSACTEGRRVQLTWRARGGGEVYRYEGEYRDDKMHGQCTFTHREGWSYTGALVNHRPTQGVLTEAGGQRFHVTYASNCAYMQNGPKPKTKVGGWACA